MLRCIPNSKSRIHPGVWPSVIYNFLLSSISSMHEGSLHAETCVLRCFAQRSSLEHIIGLIVSAKNLDKKLGSNI